MNSLLPNCLKGQSRLTLFLGAVFVVALVCATLVHAGEPAAAAGLLLLTGAMVFVPHARNIQDAAWIFTKALPAAAASNTYTAIDLENAAPGRGENTEWELEIPACPNLTDTTKNLTVKVFSTAASGDSLTGLIPLWMVQIPGVASTGTTAKNLRFRLPSTCLRYLRIQQTVDTGGGDNTAVTTTTRCLF